MLYQNNYWREEKLRRESKLDFYKYLKNKRIIVVGPAYYLKGKQLGGYIDNFDIVVRINEPMHVLINSQDKLDFGVKTNVVYLLPILTKIFITQERRSTKSWCEKRTFSVKEIQETYNRWESRGVRWIIGRKRYNKPIRIKFNYLDMPERWVDKIGKEAGVDRVRTTGILTIRHLLESKLKSLNVVGFDFYQTGYFYAKDSWQKGRSKVGTKNNPHLKYFKQLANEEKRLIIDEHLKGILNAN